MAGEGYEAGKEGTRVCLNGGSDLNTVLQRVEEAGGKVVLKKEQIALVFGYYASFRDSEGNAIHLYFRE